MPRGPGGAADSTETDRMQMIFNISQFDLFDTYLPQFKAGFANASQVGGSGCHPP